MHCSVEGCTRPIKCKGICGAHYQRKRKTGEVGAGLIRDKPSHDESLEQRLLAKRVIDGDCWLWCGSARTDGYGVIGVDYQLIAVHRLAYQLWVGHLEEGMYVCHRCDVKRCFNPQHLFLGTHEDNMRDMAIKGRSRNNPVRGASHHMTRLTEEQVRHIRDWYRQGNVSQQAIADEYGVTQTAISGIVRRKTWAAS